MGIDDGETSKASWIAVRHGLSRNGNDHVHLVVQLATDDGWINPWHDRLAAQKACRAMERARPELVELAATTIDSKTRWRYGEWRRWAEWKAERDWQGDVPWTRLDKDMKAEAIARVAASTMPRTYLSILVEACAKASRSEDEFIRRIRREGLNIDPFLRKGVGRDMFDNPDQVTGYRITWRSGDGWTERFSATDLSADLRLKALRKGWMKDPRSRALAVQEWKAAMGNRRPFLDDGAERQIENLSTHDMERLIDIAFATVRKLDAADGETRGRELRSALHDFDAELRRYGIGIELGDDYNAPLAMRGPNR